MIPITRICFYFCIYFVIFDSICADRWDRNQNNHRNHQNNQHNDRNNNNNRSNPHDNQQENQFKPSNNRHSNRNVRGGIAEDMKNPLSKDDFDRAKQLDDRFFAIDDKVLYSGKLFEGDIADDLLANATSEKNAIRNPGSHWPDGRVPYVISKDFNGEERSVIARAIDEYHSKTCIRFEPYSGSEPNYIHLVRGSGCSSRVGMVGGQQQVTLGQGCVTVGIVEHELMHALGFVHEQSRTDRDRYVRINYQNIRRGLEQNFRKYSVEEITTLNVPYDYGSVLHYGSTAFSNGNGPTIEPLERGADIGQRVGFSQIDLEKINKLYRCNGKSDSNDRYRPESGQFGNRPIRERPGRESLGRPDSGSLNKHERPGFGSSYRPGTGLISSTYRPSIVDGLFGGFTSTHRPSSGYRPSNRPDIDGDYRPGHGNGNHGNGNHGNSGHGHGGHGHRPSRPTDSIGTHGFRPSTVDPDSESYELGGGGGSRFSTHRPSGFGHSTTYRPDRETENEYTHRPSYTSTYRPYGQSRPDYGNFGTHRPSSGYETTSANRPFGGNNIGNIGSGISSIFGGRFPGSSIIENIRPGGNNNNGNRGSSIISSFLRPRPSLIGGFLGQDDPNNPATKPSNQN